MAGTGEVAGLPAMVVGENRTYWNKQGWATLRGQAEAAQGRRFTDAEIYGSRKVGGKPVMTKQQFKDIIFKKHGL